MAYHDTLFQLGMDLTRSSTAQKEDLGNTAPIAHNDVTTDYSKRDGVRFAGTHLIIDLFGAGRLDDVSHIERTIKRCAEVAGNRLLHMHLHSHAPHGGVSGVAVLSASHISMHSWPEASYAAFDIFVPGDVPPKAVIPVLEEAFGAQDVVVREHLRGKEPKRLPWTSEAGRGVSAGPLNETPKAKAPVRLRKTEKRRAVAA